MPNVSGMLEGAAKLAPAAVESSVKEGARILEEIGFLGREASDAGSRAGKLESARLSDFLGHASKMERYANDGTLAAVAIRHDVVPVDKVANYGDKTALLATGDGYLGIRTEAEVLVLHRTRPESGIFRDGNLANVAIKSADLPERPLANAASKVADSADAEPVVKDAVSATPTLTTIERYWGKEKGVEYLLMVEHDSAIGAGFNADGQLKFASLSEEGTWNFRMGRSSDWLDVEGDTPVVPNKVLLGAVEHLDAVHARMSDVANELYRVDLFSEPEILRVPEPEASADFFDMEPIYPVRYSDITRK